MIKTPNLSAACLAQKASELTPEVESHQPYLTNLLWVSPTLSLSLAVGESHSHNPAGSRTFCLCALVETIQACTHGTPVSKLPNTCIWTGGLGVYSICKLESCVGVGCGSHFACLFHLSYISISFECPFIGLLDLPSTKMQLSEFLSLPTKRLLPSGEFHIVPQCWQLIRITIKCGRCFRGKKFFF